MKSNIEFKKEIYDVKTWQQLHVTQLTYLRNLFIGLATALIALVFSDLRDFTYPTLKYTMTVSLTASLICGIGLAARESENFRLKYKIARNILRGRDTSSDEKECEGIEKENRYIFKLQAIFFAIGAINMVGTVFL